MKNGAILFCLMAAFFSFSISAQVPAWVSSLPQSSIVTISLNNPAAVMPPALANEVTGWNVSYSGFAFAPDYSTHGGMVAYGGGGYVADIFCAAAFDMATRLWVPVWTEIPPLTWADGSEYSHVQADMPGDAILWSGSTSQAAAENPWYFKPRGASEWDDTPLLYAYAASRLFSKGQTAANVPMSAHEYNCGLGIPAGALGLGEYGGLLLGMRTFATKNQAHCSMYPFILDLKRGSVAPADRKAWRILSEIPKPPGGNDNENKLFGNSCWGMTTSFDVTRRRAILSWAGGGSSRAMVAINMAGDSGTEAYSFLGDNNIADNMRYGLGRLLGGSDVRIFIEPANGTADVYAVNADPAVTSATRRVVQITNITGTAPATGSDNGFAGLSFDWVADAYGGEGAFALFTVGSPWSKALWWLKPPVNHAAWQTGQWAWEREDLTGDTPLALASENWGRFYWAPKCGVGVWCGNSGMGVQAIRSSKVIPGTFVEKSFTKTSTRLSISPNPFSGKAVINFKQPMTSMSIYDVRGICVARLAPGLNSCIWNAEHAHPGVYIITAKTAAGEVLRERMTLIK